MHFLHILRRVGYTYQNRIIQLLQTFLKGVWFQNTGNL